MTTALVSILTLGAISLGAGAGLSLTETPLLSARADGSDFHFITPSSYEEYLPLEKPMGITITDAYFAVSDGVQIHVFDKGEGTYYTYEHERTVAQLHFDERADALYFLDGTNRLHVLSFAQLKAGEKATDTGVVCDVYNSHGQAVLHQLRRHANDDFVRAFNRLCKRNRAFGRLHYAPHALLLERGIILRLRRTPLPPSRRHF